MKKITALILSIAILLGLFTVSFVSAAETDENYAEALYMLGCIDSELEAKLSANTTVTRGEFAKIISDIAMLDISGESLFSDVNENTAYFEEINAVAGFKILMGDGEGIFNPDKNVTELEVMIGLLRVLGYEEYAYYRGGYPTGYYQAARATKLTSGAGEITKDDITGNTLSLLLKNMLDEPLYEVTSIEGDYASKGLTDKSFLSIYYGIEKAEGVVTANTGTMLDKPVENGGIVVNGVFMTVETSQYDSFIGYNVEAYYSAEDNSIIYINKSEKNDVQRIQADEIVNADGSSITYEISEGKFKDISLSADVYILYNGRAPLNFKNDIFDISTGYIDLIDNDNNGVVDVVSVFSFETQIIDSINYNENIIVFKYGGGTLTDEELKDCDIFGKNGITQLYRMHEWEALDIIRSAEGEVIAIYNAGKTESKIPTEVAVGSDGGYITFDDGTTAEIRKDFVDRFNSVKINVLSIFSFDMEGKLVAYTEDSLNKLGVLVAVKELGSFETTVMIRAYVEGSQLLDKELTGRIRFNKQSKNMDIAAEKNEVVNALRLARGHMIEVETNSYGEIEAINLMEIVYDSNGVGVTCYLNTQSNVICASSTVDHYVSKSANAFYVPYELAYMNTSSAENIAVEEDDFLIRASTAVGSTTKAIVAYRRFGSDNHEAEVVRLIMSSSGGMEAMGAYDNPALIATKSKVFNEEDGKVYTKLVYWHAGTEKTAIVEDEAVIASIDDGDIAWVDTDGDLIMGVTKYYDYSEKAFTTNRTTPTSTRMTRRMQYGTCYETHNNFYTMKVANEGVDGEGNPTVTYSYESHRYPIYGYVYDSTKTKRVKKLTASDFIGEVSDPENCSKVFAHSSYKTDYMGVIYK